MSSYIQIIYDKIAFLEFKQNILFLKQPQHKASIFSELTLDTFLQIRELTNLVEEKISNGENYNLNEFEKELLEIWSAVKSYPYSPTLIAKSLMSTDSFNALFNDLN